MDKNEKKEKLEKKRKRKNCLPSALLWHSTKHLFVECFYSALDKDASSSIEGPD
jgi:hypothetical protein